MGASSSAASASAHTVSFSIPPSVGEEDMETASVLEDTSQPSDASRRLCRLHAQFCPAAFVGSSPAAPTTCQFEGLFSEVTRVPKEEFAPVLFHLVAKLLSEAHQWFKAAGAAGKAPHSSLPVQKRPLASSSDPAFGKASSFNPSLPRLVGNLSGNRLAGVPLHEVGRLEALSRQLLEAHLVSYWLLRLLRVRICLLTPFLTRFLSNPGRILLSQLTLPLLRQCLFLCLGLRRLVRRPPLISLRLLLLPFLLLVVEEGVPLGTKLGRVLLLLIHPPSRIVRGRFRCPLVMAPSLLTVVMRNFLVGRVFANRSHSLVQHDWRLPVFPLVSLGRLGLDIWVVRFLREGYVVPFHTPPPLSQVPVTLHSYSPQSIKGRELESEI